jgi:hypothetical protein
VRCWSSYPQLSFLDISFKILALCHIFVIQKQLQCKSRFHLLSKHASLNPAKEPSTPTKQLSLKEVIEGIVSLVEMQSWTVGVEKLGGSAFKKNWLDDF